MAKTAVFTFGRMNPPTVGHQKLVDKVISVAKRNNAMPHVYVSHTQNKKKDPLDYRTKMKFAKKAFGKAMVQTSARTIIEVMQELEKMGHSDVILVVGSDRVQEFKTLLNKYNGKEYNFDSIQVVSAGARDPDAEGVEGMSASKMRALAIQSNEDEFAKGVPSGLSKQDAKQLYLAVRKGMMLEEYDFDIEKFVDELDIETVELDESLNEVLTLQQRIKRSRQMKRLAPRFQRLRKIKAKRMADPKRLMQRARKQALNIVRKRVAGEKGAHYSELSPAAKISIDNLIQKKLPMIGKLAQRLLPKVRKAEMERLKKARTSKNEEVIVEVRQDQDIKDRPGTQPAKYFKDLAPSTKAKRDAQFKKQAKMDDDNPAAYKPAPGDKSAETKPSKYTKMYKDMFGEGVGQRYDVKDPVPDLMRVSMISSSKKKFLADVNQAFEMSYASRTKERQQSERERQRKAHQREKEQMKQRHAQQLDRAQVRDVRTEGPELKAVKKAKELGVGKHDDFYKSKMDPETRKKYEPSKRPPPAQVKKPEGKPFQWIKTRTNEEYLEEGVNDPAIFKAVFLAGGPGSGKSFIIDQTALIPLGFKLINSDPAFERALEKAGLDKGKPEDIFSPKGQEVRKGAKSLTNKQMKLAVDGRLGLVIDGTGKDFDKLKRQAVQLKRIGYEVAMIFVNTDLDTAQARNKQRKRTLPEDEIEKMWKEVQANIGAFQKQFGKDMFVIDNSDGSDFAGQSKRVYNKIKTWAARDPRMPQAKAWITARKKVDETFEEFTINELFEATSSIAPRDNYQIEKAMDGLKKKAEKSGFSYGTLKKVYDRGVAAWKTGHRPGTTPQQWGYARVNAFIAKQKSGKKLDHDTDLASSVRVGPYMGKAQMEEAINEAFTIYTAGDFEFPVKGMYEGDKAHDINEENWFVKLVNRYLLKPKTYKTAKEILRQVLARKRKMGQLKHSIEYYAQRIAQQFKGVDAKELAAMVMDEDLSTMVMEEHGAGEWGTDELTKKYKQDTPGQMEAFDEACEDCMIDLPIEDAIYEEAGEKKNVKLNNPFRTPGGPKKFAVYVKNEKGNVVKVTFGDPNLSIKRDDPDRKRSFRARHNCDNPGPKTKARYWSCRMWSKQKVSDLD